VSIRRHGIATLRFLIAMFLVVAGASFGSMGARISSR
jgi:hypothetical protein